MHKIVTMLVMVTTLFVAACSLSAQTAVERHGKLTTSGGYLLDKNGQIVQLRGMSFYWTTGSFNAEQFYTAANVDVLVDKYKCTVVRLAYDGKENWNLCEAVLNECIKKGIYVIIDWHSHTAHNERSTAIPFFTDKAKLYKDKPNVIFEPYNEPTTFDGSKVGTPDVAVKTWTQIKPYLQDVVTAIRGQGAENLIIAGTPYFCQFPDVAARSPLVGANIAYAFHFYSASHGINAWFVNNGPDSGKGGEEQRYLDNGLGKVPIFITEWGTTHSDGGQKTDATNTKWWFDTRINGQYHLSHCNWSVSNFEMSSAFADDNCNSLRESGKIAVPYIQNGGVDAFDTPDVLGKVGPAADTAFAMPGTQPAYRYNRYFGANFTSVAVSFSYYDNVDVRTAKNNAINVPSITLADEWVSYIFNVSTATKNIFVRYMAPAGTGSIDIYHKNVKIGSIPIKTSTTWDYAQASIPVPAGKDTLKFKFSGITGDGFKYEWFELSNADGPTGVHVQKKTVQLQNSLITLTKGGFIIDLPTVHQFTSYTITGVDGRSVMGKVITGSMSKIPCAGLTSGVWFVKLNGANVSWLSKVIISK